MTVNSEIKEEVRRFYDSIGWQQIGDGLYQNARYEDLRPVAQEYLHRCHLRVGRFLPQSGKYILDAGSGPIQYPEYLSYSDGFDYRVCLDISRQALLEARERIGDRGLFVVGDVAALPFNQQVFDGVVSLHTVHHLPAGEHERAFQGFARVARPGGKVAVVYSWGDASPLMRVFRHPMKFAERAMAALRRKRGAEESQLDYLDAPRPEAERLLRSPGTFTFKHDYKWVRSTLKDLPGLQVRVWRSVSPAFMRAFIHRRLLGRLWLRILYWLEELFPAFFGRVGQYPLIVYEAPAANSRNRK